MFGHYGDKVGRRTTLAEVDLLIGIAAFLISRTGSNAAPCLYLIAAAIMMLVVVLRMKETFGDPPRET